ncbi:MAG TPA: RNA chaperone Hfq [Armatimonadota bacterium]|jgi:host factor-I protein
MNRTQGNLQDAFLNTARKESIGVTIYLVSGVQLRGVIRAFDAFTVLLEAPGRPAQMVYKHAIASVAPVRTVNTDMGQRDDPSPLSEETEPMAETPPPAPREVDISA